MTWLSRLIPTELDRDVAALARDPQPLVAIERDDPARFAAIVAHPRKPAPLVEALAVLDRVRELRARPLVAIDAEGFPLRRGEALFYAAPALCASARVVTDGYVYLTDRRLAFIAPGIAREYPLSRIATAQANPDGCEIVPFNRAPVAFCTGSLELAIALERLMQLFLGSARGRAPLIVMPV